jgi:thiol-disulfide isomerase/thioredoxin
MRKLRWLAALVPLVTLLSVGCEESRQELPKNPVAPIPVEIRDADIDAVIASIAERKGYVVLVDFWATWCAPCRERFPHLVATAKKYADNGLVCMSVSLNEPDGKKDALTFLNEKRAEFPNFLLIQRPQDERRLVEYFGYDGGIPFMAMFDKTGKKVWDGRPSSDRQLDVLIEKQLVK